WPTTTRLYHRERVAQTQPLPFNQRRPFKSKYQRQQHGDNWSFSQPSSSQRLQHHGKASQVSVGQVNLVSSPDCQNNSTFPSGLQHCPSVRGGLLRAVAQRGGKAIKSNMEGVLKERVLKCLVYSLTHSLQDMRQQAAIAAKVFIQRDYTNGTVCQFQTKFPSELETRIDKQQFEETVRTLNNLYAEAEKLGSQSYIEGCLACLTAYTIFLCMETHYEKVLKKIAKYIHEQNDKIYAPRGLLLTDPIERGLRVWDPLPSTLCQPHTRNMITALTSLIEQDVTFLKACLLDKHFFDNTRSKIFLAVPKRLQEAGLVSMPLEPLLVQFLLCLDLCSGCRFPAAAQLKTERDLTCFHRPWDCFKLSSTWTAATLILQVSSTCLSLSQPPSSAVLLISDQISPLLGTGCCVADDRSEITDFRRPGTDIQTVQSEQQQGIVKVLHFKENTCVKYLPPPSRSVGETAAASVWTGGGIKYSFYWEKKGSGGSKKAAATQMKGL
ncbi:hypothetical protein INR49_016740, partial [Caranx melampygus]